MSADASSLLPALTHDEYAALLRDSLASGARHSSEIAALDTRNRDKFPQLMFKLSQRVNILLHIRRYGSKHVLLNSFAQEVWAKRGSRVILGQSMGFSLQHQRRGHKPQPGRRRQEAHSLI